MHRLGSKTTHLPSIALPQYVPRGNPLDARLDDSHLLGVFRQLRNRRLRILQLPQFLGYELPQFGIRRLNLDVIRHNRHESGIHFRSELSGQLNSSVARPESSMGVVIELTLQQDHALRRASERATPPRLGKGDGSPEQ